MSAKPTKRKAGEATNPASEDDPKRLRPGEAGEGHEKGADVEVEVAVAPEKQDIVEYSDGSDGSKAIIVSEGGFRRTSTLLGPTMLLEGHQAAVHCIKFNPDGNSLATGSFDKTINIWNVRGENENFMMLEGHKNVVTDLAYSSDGRFLTSCSADKVVALWDAEVRFQIELF